jgi:hypothetical protein
MGANSSDPTGPRFIAICVHGRRSTFAAPCGVRYKRMASFLHVAIPLTALMLSIVATSSFPHHGEVTAGCAIALTLLTGVNSILEPGRRYREYTEICIKLHDWSFTFEAQASHVDEPNMVAFLTAQNLELSEIGRSMAGLPIPRVQSEPVG